MTFERWKKFRVSIQGLYICNHPDSQAMGVTVIPYTRPDQSEKAGRDKGRLRQGRKEWVPQQVIQQVPRRAQGQGVGVRIRGKQR